MIGVRTYIVSYDVADDKRRAAIADCLLSYGHRLQYSVFIVKAKKATYVRLIDRVSDLMALSEDSVLVCDLGLRKRDKGYRVIGKKPASESFSSSVI